MLSLGIYLHCSKHKSRTQYRFKSITHIAAILCTFGAAQADEVDPPSIDTSCRFVIRFTPSQTVMTPEQVKRFEEMGALAREKNRTLQLTYSVTYSGPEEVSRSRRDSLRAAFAPIEAAGTRFVSHESADLHFDDDVYVDACEDDVPLPR